MHSGSAGRAALPDQPQYEQLADLPLQGLLGVPTQLWREHALELCTGTSLSNLLLVSSQGRASRPQVAGIAQPADQKNSWCLTGAQVHFILATVHAAAHWLVMHFLLLTRWHKWRSNTISQRTKNNTIKVGGSRHAMRPCIFLSVSMVSHSIMCR